MATTAPPARQIPKGLKREAVELLERREAKRSKPAPNPFLKYRKKIKPFRLLDLPGELRNMIYVDVAQQSTAVVKRRQLTDHSGLLEANTQLHDEYLSMLILHASKIQVEVTNFDFRCAVTFINRLSNTEINALPTVAKPSTRKIEIVLVVTKTVSKNEDLLSRWLNRAGNTTKKGTMLDINYKLVRLFPACFGWAARDTAADDPVCLGWMIMLGVYKRFTHNARAEAEADKIRAVFDGPTITRT